MKRLVGLFALLVALALTMGTLTAGDDGKKAKDLDAYFQKLDANKDGRLSKTEFLKMADRFRDKDKARVRLGEAFDKLDPNMKGLTLDQFRAFIDARAKKAEVETKQ
jgi:Ca2+-binding EF-hand superfamily protein